MLYYNNCAFQLWEIEIEINSFISYSIRMEGISAFYHISWLFQKHINFDNGYHLCSNLESSTNYNKISYISGFDWYFVESIASSAIQTIMYIIKLVRIELFGRILYFAYFIHAPKLYLDLSLIFLNMTRLLQKISKHKLDNMYIYM